MFSKCTCLWQKNRGSCELQVTGCEFKVLKTRIEDYGARVKKDVKTAAGVNDIKIAVASFRFKRFRSYSKLGARNSKPDTNVLVTP